MTKSITAPRTIRRIAARRVFQSPAGKTVVLTLGVPHPVPGSDWGCAVQITGLNSHWRRPRYVFGIDGFQALHLAMQCATAELESADVELEWLGQKDNLGIPRFLPDLPRRQQERLESIVEREVRKFWAQAQRRSRARSSVKPKKGTRATTTKQA